MPPGPVGHGPGLCPGERQPLDAPFSQPITPPGLSVGPGFFLPFGGGKSSSGPGGAAAFGRPGGPGGRLACQTKARGPGHKPPAPRFQGASRPAAAPPRRPPDGDNGRPGPAAPGRRVGFAHPPAAGLRPAAGPQRGLGPAAPPPRRYRPTGRQQNRPAFASPLGRLESSPPCPGRPLLGWFLPAGGICRQPGA